MTTEIKEMGGLPEGEIKLLINEAESRININLDERFSEQDMKIATMQQEVSVLVGTAKLTGWVQETKKSVDKLTENVEKLAANSLAWHDEDLQYRSEVVGRLTTVETNTNMLTEQVASIKWIVRANNALGWSIKRAMSILKEADIYKLLIVGAIIWISGHYSPNLYHWLMEVIKTMK